MKMIVSLSYKKLPQAELNMFASVVFQKMSTDTQFSGLKVWIDELKEANDAYSVALANAKNGGASQTIIKNECLAVVLKKLDKLAFEVNILANGNELVVLAAGFVVHKTPKPINEIPTPIDVKVINADESGVAYVKWKGSTAAVNYGLEYRAKGEETWRNGTYSTSQEAYIKDITPGTITEVKVCGLGRKNLRSSWSQSASAMIT